MNIIKSTIIIAILSLEVFAADSVKYVAKSPFEFETIQNTSDKSLLIITCAEFVYFPFGTLKTKDDLPKSLLKYFDVVSKLDTLNGVFEIQKLNLKSSNLILFFDNDSESTISSYIIKGEINDDAVSFVYGIKVGMKEELFFKTLFNSFPKDAINYKSIVFESCVVGIRHIYTFDRGKLKSIKFECVDCTWVL